MSLETFNLPGLRQARNLKLLTRNLKLVTPLCGTGKSKIINQISTIKTAYQARP